MNSTVSSFKKKGERKSSISTSFRRLNSSLGEYLIAIKALNTTVEGSNKPR
ncbi:MAG: hypothetical protein MK132_13315 [Lentisphaerales bacterium]|nr:hypothetical protein [Lentisphaerales bacterium]